MLRILRWAIILGYPGGLDVISWVPVRGSRSVSVRDGDVMTVAEGRSLKDLRRCPAGFEDEKTTSQETRLLRRWERQANGFFPTAPRGLCGPAGTLTVAQ